MTNTMRAVIRGARGVELVDRETLHAAAGEVVVDVAFAGVCRSDLAVADGTITVAPGRVLGHEMSGHVNGVPVTVSRSWTPSGSASPRRAFASAGRAGACLLRWPATMRSSRARTRPLSALSVLLSLLPAKRVRVAGNGRIAELTRACRARWRRALRRRHVESRSSTTQRGRPDPGLRVAACGS